VLVTYERNGYDDSDFCALVWDDSRVKEVTYASTRGWTYHNSTVVDATPEVQHAARAYFLGAVLAAELRNAENSTLVPEKYDLVLSTTTRGKNVGVRGVLRWIGPDSYARSYGGIAPMRAGIKVEGETKLCYVPLDKVQRIEPRAIDTAEITERVTNWVAGANWRSLFEHY
jgi:hypothetical protein